MPDRVLRELTCNQCGGVVVLLKDANLPRGFFETHRDGADHSPVLQRLGNVSEAGDALGIDSAEVWDRVAAGKLVAARPRDDMTWAIYRA